MKSVIYARGSLGVEYIERQIRECSKYADENGFEIIGIYIDHTDSESNTNRSQFKRMLDDSRSALFDAVIVWKSDRFSRSRADTATYKNQLMQNNVELLSATESIPKGYGGVIFESIVTGIAEGCLAGHSFEVNLL